QIVLAQLHRRGSDIVQFDPVRVMPEAVLRAAVVLGTNLVDLQLCVAHCTPCKIGTEHCTATKDMRQGGHYAETRDVTLRKVRWLAMQGCGCCSPFVQVGPCIARRFAPLPCTFLRASSNPLRCLAYAA